MNVKPARIGDLQRLFEVLRCAPGAAAHVRRRFRGAGRQRGQIEVLAALFHADAPDDVAPSAYNKDDPSGRLASPLAPSPAPTGFRWTA